MSGYWLGCYHWLIILEEEEMVVVEGQEQNQRTDISVSGLDLLNTTAVTMITKANGQISEHSEQRGAGVGNCRYQVNCNIRRQIEMFWCLSYFVMSFSCLFWPPFESWHWALEMQWTLPSTSTLCSFIPFA